MERLKELLLERGILRNAADRPLKDQHGRAVPWMFYSWGLSLDAAGHRLLGQTLWDCAQTFKSRHVAAYGLTALPLVTACVAAAGDALHGLAVRKDAKTYGTLRRVEGHGKPGQPVVLIDDSLSSGTAALTAIEMLEAEGWPVEGVICLVEFPGRGGRPRLEGLGYRVECFFDVDHDLGMAPPPLPPMALSLLPERYGPPLPEGLHPATLARAAMAAVLKDGQTPQPPASMDASYDGQGGVFVSLRDSETDARPSRDGFWHFPGDASIPPRDVVLAAAKTLRSANPPLTAEHLARLKIAVTFFGALQPIIPARLEFASHGIVVRSRVWNAKMGGALPNTQVFTHELEQYRQARFANAQLDDHEPHELYRHAVSKAVEPGVEWPSYGTARDESWTQDRALGQALISRARGHDTPIPIVPESIYAVGVSLYRDGQPTVGLAWSGSLEDCVDRAVQQLPYRDGRMAVWLLHTQEVLGHTTAQLPGVKVRLGLDSLAVSRDDHQALILPTEATHRNRGKAEFVAHALETAGIAESTATWSTFQTAGFIETDHGVCPLNYGFVEPQEAPEVRLVADYVAQHLEHPLYLPCEDREVSEGATWVTLYAADVLLQAADHLSDDGLRRQARTALEQRPDRLEPLAQCCLVRALSHLGPVPSALQDWVRELVRTDGRITLENDARNAVLDHDGLPGFALQALAVLGDVPPLEPTMRWYRQRFRSVHPWLLVTTQLPAWVALAPRVPAAAEFVVELADWLLDWQHETSGAFLADLQPIGPSCQTAWLGASMGMASQVAPADRAPLYRTSHQRALRFMNRLLVREENTFCMPSPPRCVGGVRRSLNRSDMPLEAAAHLLSALLLL